MSTLLDGLNENQLRAVTSTAPVILCLAGAGSGKTTVLTRRVANLHINHRVGTSNMLCLTFTRLAGKEMKERVMQLVGEEDGAKLFCNTFHAFAVSVLRRWGHKLGIDENFTIYDQEDREEILGKIIQEFGNRTTLKKVSNRHEKCSDYRLERVQYPEECRVLEEYGYRCKQNNAVDLNRLIDLVIRLWELYPEALAEYCQTYTHVFLDEYQDTNAEQARMIDMLQAPNLFVVGDDFQCWHEEATVVTSEGVKMVGDLQPGMRIQSVIKGKLMFAELTAKSDPKILPLIQISTESGASLTVSKSHKCFCTMPDLGNGFWYLYMMYRRDKGFRLGITKGGLEGVIRSRTFSEKPERLWFLERFNDQSIAAERECELSLKYQVPTNPYFHNGRGLFMGQDALDRIFTQFGDNGSIILNLYGLSFEHPNYIPGAAYRGSSEHHKVILYMNHLVKGNCMVSFEKNGLRIRKVFSGPRAYVDAVAFASDVKQKYKAHIIHEQYCQEKRLQLNVIPAIGVMRSMKIPVVKDDGVIELETVTQVNQLDNGRVYHLEIASTGIVVADRIVSHNSIYGWRGSKIEYIVGFPERFPHCEVIKLEDNYRSTESIVEAANSLIRKNVRQTEKKLIAHKKGPDVYVSSIRDSNQEAIFIARAVADKLNSEEGIPLKNIAVLARTNQQIDNIQRMMEQAQVPCLRVAGRDDPFNSPAVRPLLQWMYFLYNRRDNIALKKCLKQFDIKPLQFSELEFKALVDDIPLWDVLQTVEDHTHSVFPFIAAVEAVDQRITKAGAYLPTECFDLLIELLNVNKHFNSPAVGKAREAIQAWEESKQSLGENCSIQGFLKFLRYRDIQEKLIQEQDAVKLMTVHASKGLEFDTVIVAGLNQGVFPSKRGEIEEERRLFYVAVTRAKNRLILSWPERAPDWRGMLQPMPPSQFLSELGL